MLIKSVILLLFENFGPILFAKLLSFLLYDPGPGVNLLDYNPDRDEFENFVLKIDSFVIFYWGLYCPGPGSFLRFLSKGEDFFYYPIENEWLLLFIDSSCAS